MRARLRSHSARELVSSAAVVCQTAERLGSFSPACSLSCAARSSRNRSQSRWFCVNCAAASPVTVPLAALPAWFSARSAFANSAFASARVGSFSAARLVLPGWRERRRGERDDQREKTARSAGRSAHRCDLHTRRSVARTCSFVENRCALDALRTDRRSWPALLSSARRSRPLPRRSSHSLRAPPRCMRPAGASRRSQIHARPAAGCRSLRSHSADSLSSCCSTG